MCPERQLLSAYVDGEIPSPWKEGIARHAEACAKCASVIGKFSSVRKLLSGDRPPDAERIASSAWDRVASGARPRFRESLLRQRLVVPLPVAFAAALAIAVLAAALAVQAAALSRSQPNFAAYEVVPLPFQPSAATRDPGTPARSVASSSAADLFDSILRGQDAQVTITIQLPESSSFSEPGQPVILKGSPVGGP